MTTLLALDLKGRRVVVAGGGAIAARRVASWEADGAEIMVVALEARDEVRDLAAVGRLEWRERAVERGDLEGACLVLAATDDADVNAEVARWAEEARVWCVNAGDAATGTARVPATSTLGDVVVGVASLGAADPARVAGIRDAIAAHIDDGRVDLRRRRSGAGRVVLVGSGPGAADLMTVRARRALSEADVVVTDRLGATEALNHLPDGVEVIDVGKARGNHAMPQADINAILVSLAQAGNTVVRLKGGDPFVFGRGGEEMAECLAAAVPCEVVPGVTSALSVPALVGIPVTHRGVADSVLVTTGHAGATPGALAAMAAGATVVVLMGVAELPAICAAAVVHGVAPTTPVAIIERGSTPAERVTRATLESAAAAASAVGVRPPAIIVIGGVARPGLLKSADGATAP